MVTCPLTPYTSHLIYCLSPRSFGLDFLQTPPRDDALALLLTFGSANTWYRDLHPTRFVPCPPHTPAIRRARFARRLDGIVGRWSSKTCEQPIRPPFHLIEAMHARSRPSSSSINGSIEEANSTTVLNCAGN